MTSAHTSAHTTPTHVHTYVQRRVELYLLDAAVTNTPKKQFQAKAQNAHTYTDTRKLTYPHMHMHTWMIGGLQRRSLVMYEVSEMVFTPSISDFFSPAT